MSLVCHSDLVYLLLPARAGGKSQTVDLLKQYALASFPTFFSHFPSYVVYVILLYIF